jgi:hypothetical protein
MRLYEVDSGMHSKHIFVDHNYVYISYYMTCIHNSTLKSREGFYMWRGATGSLTNNVMLKAYKRYYKYNRVILSSYNYAFNV